MKPLLNKDMNTDILEQELLQLKACLREDYPIKYTEYELKHIKEEIKDLENELKNRENAVNEIDVNLTDFKELDEAIKDLVSK